MAYDYTKHIRRGTMDRWSGGAVAVQKAAPEGLRFTPEFYLQWAFDNVIRSLSYCAPEQRPVVLDLLLWMRELDDEMTYLTAYQRRDYIKLVQPSPASFDEE